MNKKILILPIIVLSLFCLKPFGFTLYCNYYIPNNEENTNKFFENCLYRSSIKDNETLVQIIEKLPIKTVKTEDFLFNSYLEKNDYKKAFISMQEIIKLDANYGKIAEKSYNDYIKNKSIK